MRVMTLINTLQSVPSFIYANHIEFFTKTVKQFPDIDFRLFTPHRMSIDNARNTAADMALRFECDYLMFIDDDVLLPANAFELMLKADKDVVAGLVIIRGMPFNVMAFEFEDEAKQKLVYLNKIELEKPCESGHERYEFSCDDCQKMTLKELVHADAVGFSCALIKTDVLKPLTPPYFVTGPTHTEDVYFCMKLRDLEPLPSIAVHTGIRCGHLLNPEPIEWATRRKMYAFYEEAFLKTQVVPKRDAAHIQRCLASLGEPLDKKVDFKNMPVDRADLV